MAKDFSYKSNDTDKTVELAYKGHTLKLKLLGRRSFVVLKELLKAYPEQFNIHKLDGVYNDPNKAHSELRIKEGFAGFLKEEKGDKRVMHITLDVPKLFEHCRTNQPEFMLLAASEGRDSLSEVFRKKIYEKFDGRCNITGLKLYGEHPKGQIFLKYALVTAYDHRRPVSKRGREEEKNFQLISKLANDEKNKICNTCDGRDCEHCALAYPEKFDVIIPTGQNIKDIRYK